MSDFAACFSPGEPLLDGEAGPECRAVVIVPARNEEKSLPETLTALHEQIDRNGSRLDARVFETVLLLNNCTDASVDVAHSWRRAYPNCALHIVERTLAPDEAHVGTARRLLMNTAWLRLRKRKGGCGILSTDSDTVVAPDWIAQNLHALDAGADAVGGVIGLKAGELDHMPEGARAAYLADREYQRLVAQLEDRLDPHAGDPWPRHLEHFGASLACTPEIYAHVGGMPAVNPLEDMAFVDRLRRADARLRHEPAVRVQTSARLEGRASVGLSWQLRTWQEAHEAGEPHLVETAAYLLHRFRTLQQLRAVHARTGEVDLDSYSETWRARIAEGCTHELTTGEFLGHIDCNGLIDESFHGQCVDRIDMVNESLRTLMEA